MPANKKKFGKKSDTASVPLPAALEETEDMEEMDPDELGLLFWGTLGEDRALKFAEG